MNRCTELLAALPTPAYITDAEGRLTFYNDAAAGMWGCRPALGDTRWCGFHLLRGADGRPLPAEESIAALALRHGRSERNVETVAERADGSGVTFEAHASLLKDENGRTDGVLVALLDVGFRHDADLDRERLVAIVTSSQDAIVSKSLEGRITSWNAGAECIFGYSAEEMIGQSIIRIIPRELQSEETLILDRLRKGERVEHFDTVRVAKDGRRVEVSLTISPLRDRAGRIVGASKVARDVTARKRDERLQQLLVGELNHRVKNTLASVQSIASQSLRRAVTPDEFVTSFNGRLQALARAHDVLVERDMQGADLNDLVRRQVLLGASGDNRVACSGPNVTLESPVAVQLSLVLHELATNARKHGALKGPEGRVAIEWCVAEGSSPELQISWRERGLTDLAPPTRRGFGTTMIERALAGNGGRSSVSYLGDGIRCTIVVPLPDVPDATIPTLGAQATLPLGKNSALEGRRVLIVEDELLVAMDLSDQLLSAGYKVIGPAATVEAALGLLEHEPDAVLLDAKLAGKAVDEVAWALRRSGIPFAFCSGYDREALPADFPERPLLRKPVEPAELIATVASLLSVGRAAAV